MKVAPIFNLKHTTGNMPWGMPAHMYAKIYFPEPIDGIMGYAQYIDPPSIRVSDKDEPYRIQIIFVANTKIDIMVNKMEIV